MIRRIRPHLYRGSQVVPVMVVIIAAQNVSIPLLPVLERMTGRAQADQWFARIDEFLDFPELFLGQRHAADENNSELGFIQGIQAGDLLAFGAFQIDAVETVIGCQILFECREGPGRIVFVFARYENNRLLTRRFSGASGWYCNEKESRKADPVDEEFSHGYP